MNGDPRDRLRRLTAAVQSRQPLPDDLAVWFGNGLQKFLDCGGRSSLDRCLGLTGRGVRSMETWDAERRRDAALAVALEFSHDGQQRDTRWRARRLTREIERFEARTWPRVRHYAQPPSHWPRLDRALFEARAAIDRDLPRTPDHLLRRLGLKEK